MIFSIMKSRAFLFSSGVTKVSNDNDLDKILNMKVIQDKKPLTKKCYIIAGPNGAGKTTFASEFLPIEAECLNFINADLIALGLSPFQPDKMAIEAGKLMIQRIKESVERNESFAFETTLSGKGYVKKIQDWKAKEYEIIIYFLKVPSVKFAIERVKLRVSQGGHNVPENDIIRRFKRGWKNFQEIYKNLADSWILYDSSEILPVVIEESEKNNYERIQ
jgi:predicted ABC-type ATPase